MILTSEGIKSRIKSGDIVIQDFNESRLGPNSYNLRLSPDMLIYDEIELDAKRENRVSEITLPKTGGVLMPGQLYIARTMEWTETRNLVPMLVGRSSIGRLGIFVHVTAGFGDVGFAGNWTLELTCVRPVKIYPGMEICQIFYNTVEGSTEKEYNGKYQGLTEATESRIWKEMQND